MYTKLLKSLTGSCILSAQLLINSSALANSGGAMDGGGGDAIVCGNNGTQYSRTVSLADTADLFRLAKGAYRDLDAFRYNEATALKVELKIFDQINPQLAEQVRLTIPKLVFQFVERLEELDDDGLPEGSQKVVATVNGLATWNCQKTQLAVQNRSTGLVRIRKDLFDNLSTSERALLKIHEAVIHLNPGAYNTTPLRALVSEIFQQSGFKNQSDPNEILNFLKGSLPTSLDNTEKDYLLAFASAVSIKGAYEDKEHYSMESIVNQISTNGTANEFMKNYGIGKGSLTSIFSENDAWSNVLFIFNMKLNEIGACGRPDSSFADYIARSNKAHELEQSLNLKFRTKKMLSSDIQQYILHLSKDICSSMNQ